LIDDQNKKVKENKQQICLCFPHRLLWIPWIAKERVNKLGRFEITTKKLIFSKRFFLMKACH